MLRAGQIVIPKPNSTLILNSTVIEQSGEWVKVRPIWTDTH